MQQPKKWFRLKWLRYITIGWMLINLIAYSNLMWLSLQSDQLIVDLQDNIALDDRLYLEKTLLQSACWQLEGIEDLWLYFQSNQLMENNDYTQFFQLISFRYITQSHNSNIIIIDNNTKQILNAPFLTDPTLWAQLLGQQQTEYNNTENEFLKQIYGNNEYINTTYLIDPFTTNIPDNQLFNYKAFALGDYDRYFIVKRILTDPQDLTHSLIILTYINETDGWKIYDNVTINFSHIVDSLTLNQTDLNIVMIILLFFTIVYAIYFSFVVKSLIMRRVARHVSSTKNP